MTILGRNFAGKKLNLCTKHKTEPSGPWDILKTEPFYPFSPHLIIITDLLFFTIFNHHRLIFTISYHPLTFFWPYFIANFSLFRCILSPCCKFKEIFLFLLNLIVWIAMGSALDWKQKGWSAFDGQISLISDHPKRNLISENFKNVKPGM